MNDFLKAIEMVLVDLWNYLYVLLSVILEGDTSGVNPFPKDPVEDPYA